MKDAPVLLPTASKATLESPVFGPTTAAAVHPGMKGASVSVIWDGILYYCFIYSYMIPDKDFLYDSVFHVKSTSQMGFSTRSK